MPPRHACFACFANTCTLIIITSHSPWGALTSSWHSASLLSPVQFGLLLSTALRCLYMPFDCVPACSFHQRRLRFMSRLDCVKNFSSVQFLLVPVASAVLPCLCLQTHHRYRQTKWRTPVVWLSQWFSCLPIISSSLFYMAVLWKQVLLNTAKSSRISLMVASSSADRRRSIQELFP